MSRAEGAQRGPAEAPVEESAAEGREPVSRGLLALAGVVWVSWPKKASKVPTDITEDVIREICLPMGLVDVKVCAVDATWSGLKLVVRRQNRDVRPHPAGPA